jgi:hypothetical protein
MVPTNSVIPRVRKVVDVGVRVVIYDSLSSPIIATTKLCPSPGVYKYNQHVDSVIKEDLGSVRLEQTGLSSQFFWPVYLQRDKGPKQAACSMTSIFFCLRSSIIGIDKHSILNLRLRINNN